MTNRHCNQSQESLSIQFSQNSTARVKECMLVSASPVLAKVKPAVLVSLSHECRKEWAKHENQLYMYTGLRALTLNRSSKSYSLLLYSPSLLSEKLDEPDARSLLDSLGYPSSENLGILLSHLRKRYSFLNIELSSENPFPHEIGLFLGYPYNDVNSFIINRGKKYKLCKYWKVYHNEEAAVKTFDCIDKAKKYAAMLITKQIPIHLAGKMLTELHIS